MLKSPSGTTRRSALKILAVAAGAVASWRPEFALGATQTRADVAPPPSFVPPAFHFRRRIDRLADGFGGATDVTYVYVNRDIPLANAFPLLVCGSYDPRHALGGTANVPGHPMRLVSDEGQPIEVRYHDGMWWLEDDGRVVWNIANAHSLSFAKAGITYGIRGARSAGVTLVELQKVALSFV